MTPCLVTILLLLLYLAPKHVEGLSYFMPLLPLIPVFFWGLLHARDMPFWFVFLLGLVMDAAQGLQLGLSSLLYVFFLLLLHAQRKYIIKEGFAVKWGYFGLLLGITCLLSWAGYSLLSGQAHPIVPVLIQYALTMCCYPFFHRLFDILYEHTNHRRWQIQHGR
jgi:rod shape-determining protein MreD